jgi:hypothetical protein
LELYAEFLGVALQAAEAPELPRGLAQFVWPLMLQLGCSSVVGHFEASQVLGQAASGPGETGLHPVAAMMQQ